MLYSAHMRPRRLIALVLVSLVVLFFIAVAVRRSQRDEEPGPSATPAATPTVSDQRTPTAGDTPSAGETPEAEPVASINVITEEGGRVDWSDKLDLIAFDRIGDDGFTDVWTMKPDGSEQQCITCDVAALPGKHMGNPAWHPSGDYIVFQAEKAESQVATQFAAPGRGVNNDLWFITRDARSFSQLTDLPLGRAVLHPHFSSDGSKLLWSEMLKPPPGGESLGGEWRINLSDFVVEGGQATLQNTQSLQPNGPVFYETHGFSSDGSKIIFTSTPESGRPVFAFDIYTVDIGSGQLANLTGTSDQWDEHAHYAPSGDRITWMSSSDCGCDPGRLADLRTDLWIMNADGSAKTRLTHFSDSAFPERLGRKVLVGDAAWSADGSRLVAFLIVDRGLLDFLNVTRNSERIAVIQFAEPQ